MPDKSPIEKYLDYYLDIKNELNFAVLLDGKWGSGKTHFIKKYISEYKEKNRRKYYYISLYGVSSKEELGDKIFKNAYPILTGNLVPTVHKAASTYAGIKTGFGLPSLDINRFLKLDQDAILVFDDLERVNIGKSTILGYINFFVEHKRHKCIVIANEEEVRKSRSSNTQEKDESDENSEFNEFDKIKEKLIGRTLTFESDITSAINAFIGSIHSYEVQSLMRENESELVKLYLESKYENLRSLKQAMTGFSEIYFLVDAKMRTDKHLMAELLQNFVVLTFELRAGTVKFFRNANSKPQKVKVNDDQLFSYSDTLGEKYSNFRWYSLFPSNVYWSKYYQLADDTHQVLEKALKESKYFYNEQTESWKKLWHYYDLEDSDFTKLVEDVQEKLKKDFYDRPGVILHVAGILLQLSKNKMIHDQPVRIRKDVIASIGRLHSANRLVIEIQPDYERFGSYMSLGFLERDSDEFKEILAHLNLAEDKISKKLSEDELKSILDLKNSEEFWHAISPKFPGNISLKSWPILNSIPAEQFAQYFLSLPNKDKERIGYAFKDRYEFAHQNPEMIAELDWLKELDSTLTKLSTNLGPVTTLNVLRFQKLGIKAAITKIEELES